MEISFDLFLHILNIPTKTASRRKKPAKGTPMFIAMSLENMSRSGGGLRRPETDNKGMV